MRDVHAPRLESLHKAGHFQSTWHPGDLLLLLLFKKFPRMFDVVMAGKRQIPWQFFEAITAGVSSCCLERLPRIAAGEQIKNAQPLLRAGRSVEPGHEPLVPQGRLADAESVVAHAFAVI